MSRLVAWEGPTGVLVVKNLLPNAGDERDLASIPGSRKLPRGGYGNPLQYSCLKNLMDKIAWQATVHGVAKNQTQLKRLSMPACPHGSNWQN